MVGCSSDYLINNASESYTYPVSKLFTSCTCDSYSISYSCQYLSVHLTNNNLVITSPTQDFNTHYN